MNSLVAKSCSSSGLSFINEEPLYEERLNSVDEPAYAASSPLYAADSYFSPPKNCLSVQGTVTICRPPPPDLPLSTSNCSNLSVSDHETVRNNWSRPGSDVTSTPELAPKGILRAPRLMAAPKQLSFDIPLSPAPSPKSSCVSASGSYHMFERPARVSRVRKEPGRFRLAALQQRSNSESIFNMSPQIENCRRVSVAHFPSRDQALLRKILGPQGLSWISTDKGVLMIIENELNAAGIVPTGSFSSLCLKSLIVGSTIVLVVFVAYFHIIEVQLFMNANAADDWRVALTLRRMAQIGGSRNLHLFTMSTSSRTRRMGPGQTNLKGDTYSLDSPHFQCFRLHSNVLPFILAVQSDATSFQVSTNFFLWKVQKISGYRTFRLFTDASSRSIAGLNRVNFNARFILKTLMTLCPGKMLMIFTAFLWIMAGWILRLCERDYVSLNQRKDMDYVSSIWVVAITFLSVGYGDIVPHTNCGRTMAVITGILKTRPFKGTCASSMVVAVVARKLELTRAEKHVHNFMMDTQLTKQLKHSAANVLRETWLIYKFRKKVEKIDYARIRQHQRKFLVAIYECVGFFRLEIVKNHL
ncbi:calmodulin binding domain protein [Ancylostoma ceylanicum]|uniref:Calmodulin binding domain protein n=1 Tax=Ancylostoma ceylanicum TaxID=53326 RepID=A0A0D6LXW6_9BILA|nr:calmodulin binding domain protein [Ancylostoma ceylanicum]